LGLVVAGLLLGVLVTETALRFVDLRPGDSRGEDAYRRMHYIYTKTGLGKCYPSNPHDYFPYDLRTEEGMAKLGSIIAEVASLPDDWSLDEKVEHLRGNTPYCNNIELALLNGGPYPERSRDVLLIGDSFAFGEGLRLRDTIGYELAELVPEANFPNMAWPGSSIDTVFDVAKAPAETDVVLYLYNINDIARTDELILRRDLLHDAIRQRRVSGEDRAGDGVPAFCRRSRLCWMLYLRRWESERSRESIEYFHELYFAESNRAPRRHSFDEIAAMKTVLAERGVRFVVVMFPLYYKAPLADYPFRDIHELVGAEMRRRGVEFLDLLPAFDGYFSWYRFTVHPLDRHPSAEAIAIAADYLHGNLRLDEGVATAATAR
jgi:hypothetical protein